MKKVVHTGDAWAVILQLYEEMLSGFAQKLYHDETEN